MSALLRCDSYGQVLTPVSRGCLGANGRHSVLEVQEVCSTGRVMCWHQRTPHRTKGATRQGLSTHAELQAVSIEQMTMVCRTYMGTRQVAIP